MMSTSSVKKSPSVAVRPSAEPPMTGASDTTTTTRIKLSALDKANFPLSVLLVYQNPIRDAADTVKTALSHALVHYYPFCGRVVSGADDGDGGSYIECTAGEGAVEFVAASADCTLQASKLLERLPSYGGGGDTSSPLDELAVCYGRYGAGDPLLSVQVTEFTCGGFVVGATWSHAVADGVGIAQFLRAVGELAAGRGGSPSVVPVRWDEAVASQPLPPADPVMLRLFPAWFGGGPAPAAAVRPLPLVLHDVTIPASFISRVKAEFVSPATTCTTFEVVLAALWRCRTRAIMSGSGSASGSRQPPPASADTISVVAFAANVRKFVGARDGYYGNCVVDKFVVATSRSVANGDIVDLVAMIKRAKDELAADMQVHKKEDKNNVAADRHQLLQLQGLDEDGRYSMFTVSSWRNIGFEEAYFGSGQPARVMCHAPGVPPVPACIAFKGRDGGANVLSFCVKEEHADAFLVEIAKLT